MEADAEEIELHKLVTLANEGDENAIVQYLGIHTTLYAVTKQSRMIWLRKMEGAIRKLSSSPLRGDTLKSIFNILCASLTSDAILPTQVTFELAKKLDAMTISHMALKFGIFSSDCRIPLFLPEKDLGIGVRSFVTPFVTSICRELEVQLNVQNLCGEILRAMLVTLRWHYNDFIRIPNFVLQNARQIAYCGLMLRDGLLEFIHWILDIVMTADKKLYIWGDSKSKAPSNTKGRIHGPIKPRAAEYNFMGPIEGQLILGIGHQMSPNSDLEVLEKSLCDKEVWQTNPVTTMRQVRGMEQVTGWVKKAYQEKWQDLQSAGSIFKRRSNGTGSYPGRGRT